MRNKTVKFVKTESNVGITILSLASELAGCI